MKIKTETEETKTKLQHEDRVSFEALSKIVMLLEPLPAHSQARIIRSLVVFFEVPVKDL